MTSASHDDGGGGGRGRWCLSGEKTRFSLVNYRRFGKDARGPNIVWEFSVSLAITGDADNKADELFRIQCVCSLISIFLQNAMLFL